MPTIDNQSITSSYSNLLTMGEGMIAQNYNRVTALGGVFTQNAQDLRGSIIYLKSTDLITNVHVWIDALGATPGNLTHGQIGLFRTSGVGLRSTADSITPFTISTGLKTIPLSSQIRLKRGTYLIASWLDQSAAGGIPSSLRCGVPGTGISPVGSGVSALVVQTGRTTFPATATFISAGSSWWFGLS